ncbi:MAG TPA: DNA replication/repair protein RecF [Rudaea sp.]|nr:DNA replication/repair protein RecF [Rudaea sp.]
MKLTELRLENWRNISESRITAGPGINLLEGPNGAGKTSVLEAIYLLSHGRSFRTQRGEVLVRQGASQAVVYAEIEGRHGSVRLGVMQADGRWSARVDGQGVASMTAAIKHCAVVCFEPGSHALIGGPSDERRRFLDWGVFHVEPDFATVSRRFRRALRQRNALLRNGATASELSAWDEELVSAGMALHAGRMRYVERMIPALRARLRNLIPDLGEPALRYVRGWGAELEFAAALAESRGGDRLRGHTTRGPHRADWKLSFERAPQREQLSRGQEKLCAIACMLAQAELFEADHGEWPIVVLDDLPSELDLAHQRVVVDALTRERAQVFLTSTEVPRSLLDAAVAFESFHVEQGRVSALL